MVRIHLRRRGGRNSRLPLGIANALRWQRAHDQVLQLQNALRSRADIDQAKGVLMAIHGISSDQAFERLAKISNAPTRKFTK
ncbi:ANTAR domain-containing protein [Rhodococcus sp. NPDC019627]|uniref:ANTAR domain-containing protein n=1 Tax=unclassified Rhodococcus (in: high G+C Gram-positive bacteria) TaxID=192944 RepID=UPI00340B09D6